MQRGKEDLLGHLKECRENDTGSVATEDCVEKFLWADAAMRPHGDQDEEEVTYHDVGGRRRSV